MNYSLYESIYYNLNKLLDFFKLFLSNEFINEIVHRTNNYTIKDQKEKYYSTCPDKLRIHLDKCFIKYRTKQQYRF